MKVKTITEAIKHIAMKEEIPFEDISYFKDKNAYFILNKSYTDFYKFKNGELFKLSCDLDGFYNKFYKKSQTTYVYDEKFYEELADYIFIKYFTYIGDNSKVKIDTPLLKLISSEDEQDINQLRLIIKTIIDECIYEDYSMKQKPLPDASALSDQLYERLLKNYKPIVFKVQQYEDGTKKFISPKNKEQKSIYI